MSVPHATAVPRLEPFLLKCPRPAPATRLLPLPPSPNVQVFAPLARGLGVRGRVSLGVRLHDRHEVLVCRAVELSASGIVLERGRRLTAAECKQPVVLTIFLPGAVRVSVLATTARTFGTRQALKFAIVKDADRLTLMEHLDRLGAREAPGERA
jgi:hypothetical protein